MKIGYACTIVGLPLAKMKTCRMKDASPEKISLLVEHNLHTLQEMMAYNQRHKIELFRISSDLIPFGSSPVNSVLWWEEFQELFFEIGKIIRAGKIRVSMHPGQYTVLNSPNREVVNRAILDLDYHCKVLDCLGTDSTSKIILHIGGVYEDRQSAIERFKQNYQLLSPQVKRRLVIENDDRSFCAQEVLEIAKELGIPMIFDVFHHEVLPSIENKSIQAWVENVSTTWKKEDGTQKIHYSQQNPDKKAGAHSETICLAQFIDFFHQVENQNMDIMLEVKDKNVSALKCKLALIKPIPIPEIEKEWGRYKYLMLEHSHRHYLLIRAYLKNKDEINPVKFYGIIEEGLQQTQTNGGVANAAMHVWGYFKNKANPKQKKVYDKLICSQQAGENKQKSLKSFLLKLAIEYEETYLLESYYF